MPRLRCFACLLPLVLPPALAAQALPDAAAVRAVLAAYAEFSQAKNLSAIDTLMAPGRGVHIIEGAGVNHGWAEYRDDHIGKELPLMENFRYRFFAIEPQVRGDLAWASFRYDLGAVFRGESVELEGRGTAVLERRDGRWLIVHLHTSGRPKAPGGGS